MPVTIVVHAAVLAALLVGPPAPAFDPDALDGVANPGSDLRLEPRRDGSYVYRNADSQFRAVIHGDGSVEYLPPPADHHLTFLGFDLSRRRPRAEPEPAASDSPHPPLPPQPGTRDPTHEPSSYGAVPILIGFGGRMPGLLDMVQRGQHFAAKARFLDDTAVLRRELARQVGERHTRERLGSLEAELAAIWRDPDRPAATRRARLFERWDECAERDTGVQAGSGDDARRADAGERGRRQIEAFVRREAPAGTDLAFTATELERFNARRHSRERFDPYARVIDEPGQNERSATQ